MTNTCSRVEAIIRDYAGLKHDFSFHNETDFRADCHFDSLDLISLAMKVEDEFGIQITDDEVDSPALATLGGLVAHVDGKLLARAKKFEDFKHSLPTVENPRAAQ